MWAQDGPKKLRLIKKFNIFFLKLNFFCEKVHTNFISRLAKKSTIGYIFFFTIFFFHDPGDLPS